MELNNLLTLAFGILATGIAVAALLYKCKLFRSKIRVSQSGAILIIDRLIPSTTLR
jgi:hypothetical protein